MESKHKNALIGALLAVVFVMAVGYAAFATTLTINGTAEISSTWDVHFDPTVQTATPSKTVATGQEPSGTIELSSDNLTATLTADLKQPGDQVVYTLQPKNFGSITAKTTGAVAYVTGNTTGTADALTAAQAKSSGDVMTSGSKQVGNIIYSLSFTPETEIAAGQSDGLITVTVQFDPNAKTTGHEYAAIHVTIPYTQA